MTATLMGTGCQAHHHRELVPLESHHIHPLGHGGPNTPANRVTVCANAHSSIHYLLAQLLRYEGQVPWSVRRMYGRRVRVLAVAGYQQIKAAQS